jgi:hypothetical protein
MSISSEFRDSCIYFLVGFKSFCSQKNCVLRSKFLHPGTLRFSGGLFSHSIFGADVVAQAIEVSESTSHFVDENKIKRFRNTFRRYSPFHTSIRKLAPLES